EVHVRCERIVFLSPPLPILPTSAASPCPPNSILGRSAMVEGEKRCTKGRGEGGEGERVCSPFETQVRVGDLNRGASSD
ncbi:hypothetical protein BCR35DRAFT_301098, partial [Leucosporidium creatinivorum]